MYKEILLIISCFLLIYFIKDILLLIIILSIISCIFSSPFNTNINYFLIPTSLTTIMNENLSDTVTPVLINEPPLV